MDCDATGPMTKKLYLDQALYGFLPVTLYFDNDEPDRRTMSTRTRKNYSQTFNRYYPKKSKFVRECSKGNSDASALDDFFESEVKGGYEKFQAFLKQLEIDLERGRGYKIYLIGYASPRAKSSYNKNLSKRRIKSVMNEFSRYQNGRFRKYLANGTLQVLEKPLGEENAPAGISDRYDDPVGSIYCIEPSRERRVEIIEIKE